MQIFNFRHGNLVHYVEQLRGVQMSPDRKAFQLQESIRPSQSEQMLEDEIFVVVVDCNHFYVVDITNFVNLLRHSQGHLLRHVVFWVYRLR